MGWSSAAASIASKGCPGSARETHCLRQRNAADFLRFGMDPLLILRDLASLGDVDRIELDVTRSTLEQPHTALAGDER